MQVSDRADSKENNRAQQEASERETWEIKGDPEFNVKPVGIIKDKCICICNLCKLIFFTCFIIVE